MKYKDITKEMYNAAKPKEGKIEKQNFFESNGEKYFDNTLQTVSDDAVLSQIDEIYNTGKFSWVNTIYVLKENKFIRVYKRK